MKNKEKYLDNMFSIFVYNHCSKFYESCFGEECFGNGCSECKFSTIEKISTWLNEEYHESELKYKLLKNGDNLKPGDWIMVRNSHDWRKRAFMCYKDGYFITSDGGETIGVCGGYSAWNQARLPEDGE